ncbi:MAG: glycerophosphodiester phosphodiesterase [Geobacter sp.]|nr:MAG: glycerophosphodiester phosphodiesterase [Geobacter sp.]
MIKVGHRGARACEPENTLLSFKKALELGVDAVELDVRKTKDNEIVVIHDADLKRTTNGEGLVSDLTLKEMKVFVTEKDQRIPTLEEVLDLISKKVKVFVELKEPGFEEKVLELVEKKGLRKNVIIVSFLEDALKRVRELDAQIETGLIYAKHKNPLKAALEVKAQWLLSFYRFTHTADVEKAHAKGLKVLVWTVNTSEEMTEMTKKGLDAIATDKPDLLVAVEAGKKNGAET